LCVSGSAVTRTDGIGRLGHDFLVRALRSARRRAGNPPAVRMGPADPSTYFAGYDKSKVSPISCPDNLDFDRPRQLDLRDRRRPDRCRRAHRRSH
jgi:hypothetical protein